MAYKMFKDCDYLISVSKLCEEDKFRYDNGAIGFARIQPFINEWTWYGENSHPFLLPTIDIDTEEDFLEAERLMIERNLNHRG